MYEVFNMFLDAEIVDAICTFTNAEASRVVQESSATAAPNRMFIKLGCSENPTRFLQFRNCLMRYITQIMFFWVSETIIQSF
jgi:hypothetical protein